MEQHDQSENGCIVSVIIIFFFYRISFFHNKIFFFFSIFHYHMKKKWTTITQWSGIFRLWILQMKIVNNKFDEKQHNFNVKKYSKCPERKFQTTIKKYNTRHRRSIRRREKKILINHIYISLAANCII